MIDTQTILDELIVICSDQSNRVAVANSNLVTDLGFDSLDLVSISMTIEEHFPAAGPIDYDPMTMQTVNDIAMFVEGRLKAVTQ